MKESLLCFVFLASLSCTPQKEDFSKGFKSDTVIEMSHGDHLISNTLLSPRIVQQSNGKELLVTFDVITKSLVLFDLTNENIHSVINLKDDEKDLSRLLTFTVLNQDSILVQNFQDYAIIDFAGNLIDYLNPKVFFKASGFNPEEYLYDIIRGQSYNLEKRELYVRIKRLGRSVGRNDSLVVALNFNDRTAKKLPIFYDSEFPAEYLEVMNSHLNLLSLGDSLLYNFEFSSSLYAFKEGETRKVPVSSEFTVDLAEPQILSKSVMVKEYLNYRELLWDSSRELFYQVHHTEIDNVRKSYLRVFNANLDKEFEIALVENLFPMPAIGKAGVYFIDKQNEEEGLLKLRLYRF